MGTLNIGMPIASQYVHPLRVNCKVMVRGSQKKERGKCPLSDNNRKVASVNICEKKLPREDFFSIGKCIKHLSSNEMLMFLYYTHVGTVVLFINKNFMLVEMAEMNSRY